jgi:tetratricopeptide (TPR) repeat protein
LQYNNPVFVRRLHEIHALIQSNQLVSADTALMALAPAHPNSPDIFRLLGQLRFAQGREREGCEALSRATTLSPNDFGAWLDFGYALLRASAPEQAQSAFANAERCQRGNVDAQLGMAVAASDQGHYANAIALLKKLLSQHPSNAAGWHNLAFNYSQAGEFTEVVRCAKRALAYTPEDESSVVLLVSALLRLHELDQAQQILDHWFTRFGRNCSAVLLNFQGEIHLLGGDGLAAVRTFRAAVALEPTNAMLRNNLSKALEFTGQFAEAITAAREALTLSDNPMCHLQLSLLLLGSGQTAEGWKHYLRRPLNSTFIRPFSSAPDQHPGPGSTSNLVGRNLVIVGEQGLGDVVFFLRFLPLLKGIANAVYLDVDTRLHEILRSSEELSWIHFFSPSTSVIDPITLPLGDLPALLACASFPGPLRFQPTESTLLGTQQRLSRLGPPPYIGVTWEAGSKPLKGRRAGVDMFKRIDPALLGEHLRAREGTFVILQRNPDASDVAKFTQALGRQAADCSDINADLSSALAMLASLDEYIAVSNTNLHLRAGVTSSGVRHTTTLVCHPPEWRWGQQGSESPWFPGVRVLRELAPSGYPDTWSGALSAL